MRTKSGKSHWICTTKTTRKSGTVINESFRFVAFDGIAHLKNIQAAYFSKGIGFEFYNLVNLDEA